VKRTSMATQVSSVCVFTRINQPIRFIQKTLRTAARDPTTRLLLALLLVGVTETNSFLFPPNPFSTGVAYYSYFKSKCPNSYVYAYDESSKTALFTCPSGSKPDYTLTFCPSQRLSDGFFNQGTLQSPTLKSILMFFNHRAEFSIVFGRLRRAVTGGSLISVQPAVAEVPFLSGARFFIHINSFHIHKKLIFTTQLSNSS